MIDSQVEMCFFHDKIVMTMGLSAMLSPGHVACPITQFAIQHHHDDIFLMCHAFMPLILFFFKYYDSTSS